MRSPRSVVLVRPHLLPFPEDSKKQTADTKIGLLLEIVEALPIAVIVLDAARNGVIIYENSLAQKILVQGDGIRRTATGVELTAAPKGALDKMLATIAAADLAGTEQNPTLFINCPAPAQTRIRLRRLALPKIRENLALLYIERNTGPQKPNLRALQEAWNLTRAEAKLALALATSGDLRKAAKACHLTIGTARQYLKKVFGKTDVRGQVELVVKLLQTP